MLYSEPMSMHRERPGLHDCALWEIGSQLASVESFPLLFLIAQHKVLSDYYIWKFSMYVCMLSPKSSPVIGQYD